MRFTKMQGCGNDYIYVNCFDEKVDDPASLAVRLSDRHYGIGSDGLILIEPSAKADAYMRMFNLDGSEGLMCGNGIRCTAKYIYDHGIIPADRTEAMIDTASGIKTIKMYFEDGKVCSATVDMGIPKLTGQCPEKIEVCGMTIEFIGVDTGNPHAVIFLDDNPVLKESAVGIALEGHERFPEGVNTGFIRVVSRSEIIYSVWERGSGETLACGTGATAAVFAGIKSDKLDDEVLVHLKGGDLLIRYERETDRCYMTGPAVEVFSGSIDL